MARGRADGGCGRVAGSVASSPFVLSFSTKPVGDCAFLRVTECLLTLEAALDLIDVLRLGGSGTGSLGAWEPYVNIRN
jgi:hypothetical protein